jgi:hypothetical protein
MGIFTVPTLSVRKTRIYVSPSSTSHREQLTLYKTEVTTQFDDGFLILPVPYPNTVRIHRPHTPFPPYEVPYLDFFNRVESAFDDRDRRNPRPMTPPRVTSYRQIDILRSIDELREFNDREAILHESVIDQLAEIYSHHYWGFLLCSLRTGSYLYEPICYTHQMISDHLFVPSLIYQPQRFNDVRIPEESDQFDDRYFMNGCQSSDSNSRGYHLIEVNPNRVHTIPWETLPTNYRHYLPDFLSESRRGMHWNCDSMYRINESLYREYHPRERSSSPVTPW